MHDFPPMQRKRSLLINQCRNCVFVLFVGALDHEKVKEYPGKTGQFAFPTSPEGLMKFQISEHDKWRKIILAAGIQPE